MSKTRSLMNSIIFASMTTNLFAAPFEGDINKYSKEFGVDKYLIASVIKIESDFNKKAISSKGAKGLMQLMDFTAKKYNVKDSFNSADNIMGGTHYLMDLIKRYKNIDFVLAAYNAGETAVDKYNGIPPYKETSNYVRKVKAAYKGLTGNTLVLKKKESSFKSPVAFSNPVAFSDFQSSFQSAN